MKVKVICYPKKLIACLTFACVVVIVIQLSGYGLKDLEESRKEHVNFALPTLRNAVNGLHPGKIQNTYKEPNKFTRTDHERLNKGPKPHILIPDKADGLQIQMPFGVNPSNLPPAHRYREVPPVFLEEDTCPACYGKSLCDQFYAGHIKVDRETEGLPRVKHVFFGFWEGYRGNFQEPPLPVVVKKLIKDGELLAFEDFLCNNTDSGSNSKTIGCDVGDKIMRTKLASNSIFQMKYARTELYKVAHKHVTAIGLAMCASQRLLDNLTKLYNIPTRRDTDYRSPKVAMLATSFVLNPEALVIKFCHQHIPEVVKYIPKYYGECGRMVVVQPGGTPLQNYLNESWQVRVGIALQILQMLEDFTTASPTWMLFFADFRFDNFCVSESGRIQLIDLEDVVIIDREEIKQLEKHHPAPVINETCNEDCLFNLGKTIYQDPVHHCGRMPRFASPVMHMLACQRLLSDLETTKYMRLFDDGDHGNRNEHSLGGLLHHIPSDLEPKLSELLYECVFESKPGSRIYAVKALKMLLGIIERSYKL